MTATLAAEDGLAVGSRLGLQGVDAPVDLRVVGILAGDGPWGGPTGRAVVIGAAGRAVGVRRRRA